MFHERIKELRLSLNMTQAEFAQKLNISQQRVSNLENACRQPSVDILRKISETFSVSCDYLLDTEYQNNFDTSDLTVEQIIHLQHIIKHLKALNSDG